MSGSATPPVVVKVGGSLLDWPPLPDRLRAFLAGRAPDRLLLIVGGGGAADLVRALDRRHALGEARAHDLAVRALDWTAHLLAGLVPELGVVTTTAQAQRLWDAGRTPILAPRRFLLRDEAGGRPALPHSWSVTSDTIAARVAHRIGATELVLLKSAPLPRQLTLESAARHGLVDPVFPHEARSLRRVTFVAFRDWQADLAIPGMTLLP